MTSLAHVQDSCPCRMHHLLIEMKITLTERYHKKIPQVQYYFCKNVTFFRSIIINNKMPVIRLLTWLLYRVFFHVECTICCKMKIIFNWNKSKNNTQGSNVGKLHTCTTNITAEVKVRGALHREGAKHTCKII